MAAAKAAPGPLKAAPTPLRPAAGPLSPSSSKGAPSTAASPSSSSSSKPPPATAASARSPSNAQSSKAPPPTAPMPNGRLAPLAMSPQHAQQQAMRAATARDSPAKSSSSTPKSSTARGLLEARAESSKQADLPLQIKMMLQKRPEMWADPTFAREHMDAVWAHYDVNKDGILNKSELLALAKDLVDRLLSQCRDLLKGQMPKASDSELDKILKKESAHILPAKTIEESRKIIAEHIFVSLDLDKDGVITRTEFCFAWTGCAQKVLDVNKQKTEALSCAIL